MALSTSDSGTPQTLPRLTDRAIGVASTVAWMGAAALFGTLLTALRHVDHVGAVPPMLLVVLLVLSAWRPLYGLAVAAALVPVATNLAARYWNGNIAWPTPIVYAVLTGISVHALTPAGRRMRLPGPLTTPALCFGAVVTVSTVVGLSPAWLRLGPSFGDALLGQLTREHFVDSRSFPAFQTGLLLLQGVVLFVAAARLSTARAGAFSVLAATVAAGAAIAAAMTGKRLYDAAERMADFWPAVVRLVTTLRWNVAYPDMNAAGSYFLMTALVAGGLAIAAHRKGVRAAAIGCALLSVAALWLTGSRAAMLAGLLAAMLAAAIRMARGARPRLLSLAALAGVALVGGLALAMLLPKKGNQVSSQTAAHVRVGLAETSARMIASRPFFGIGLAEFSRRSGEFSSAELLAAFPPAVHENAHNNFLQIAAELGLLGGALFLWLIGAGLWYAAPRAQDRPDPASPWVWLALVAFVLTWLGGHPLLVPEAALPFWILLGAAAGRGAFRTDGRRWGTPVALACLLLLAVTLPWRLAAERDDQPLEHVGIGVSGWRTDDDERYRVATGAATVFVPAGAFSLRVKPLTDRPVTLELQLGGRVANRVILRPSVWNDVRMPARTQRPTARYPALRLIVGDPADAVTFRMTKVVPLGDGPG